MNQQSPANYSYKIVKLKQHQKCTQLHLTILAKLNSLTKHFSKCLLLNLFLLIFLYKLQIHVVGNYSVTSNFNKHYFCNNISHPTIANQFQFPR